MPVVTSALDRQPLVSAVPTERAERVLAVGRAFLTVAALVAIYIDPSEPARLQEVTYGLLTTYALYSLSVWAFVHRSVRLAPWHTYLLHGLDVLWASALTFASQGPISPFFLFFLFVVVAAAYRWGFRETLGTALVTVAIFLGEASLAMAGPWKGTAFSSFEFDGNSAILRVAYLLLTGVLLGYLAEQDKEARAELAAMAAAARQPHLRAGLGGSVTSLGQTLLSAFDASSVAVVVKDEDTRRVLLWRLDTGQSHPGRRVRREELDASAEQQWFFPVPGDAWHLERRPAGATPASLRVATAGAWRLSQRQTLLPAPLLTEPGWLTITAVDMGFAGEWRARAYVFGGRDRRVERRVHFLQALADHATPALTNVFLLRRLRARAGAAERARVARELHDGAIQSLFAIDMKLEAMRRDGAPAGSAPDRIVEVQALVRQEVAELRSLMQALRPIELDASDQLPDVLANVVERFARETGLGARFVSTGGRVALLPASAIELVKITQEALVNVRKHSRAGQVLVRLAATDSACQLVIEDDGRGFDFEGRLSAAELDDRHAGPAVIKERARLIGADLAVESAPGGGARIEITLRGDVLD